jgi:hypothetical protein
MPNFITHTWTWLILSPEPAALTAELWALDIQLLRAGGGNRTRNNSLEGWGNTILQRPRRSTSRGGRT